MNARFEETWSDSAQAEAAVVKAHGEERTYRRMLAITDVLLGRLEDLNLSGRHELDEATRTEIERAMPELTPQARARFPRTRRVQEALNGMFDVQEELLLVLQRMVHWDRLAMPPQRDGAGEGSPSVDLVFRRSA